MAEEQKAAEVAAAPDVVPIVDIPPDEKLSVETLADKTIGDAVMTTTDEMETTTTTTTVVTTEVTVTEVVKMESTAEVKIEEVMMESGEVALGKREREEENGADEAKRIKVEENGKDEKAPVEPVKLGPKLFHSAIEMFTYFYDILHGWVANVDLNKYEFMVLSDLITRGHRDAETKIGSGIKAFQVRFHPGWHSRCYYLIRTDGSMDDFSYRKCVDKLMPLPESLFSPSGDLIVEKLFGSADRKGKGKGKGGADNGGKEGKGYQGHKGRGGGGGWRGGGGGGGRGGGGRGSRR